MPRVFLDLLDILYIHKFLNFNESCLLVHFASLDELSVS